MADNYEDIDEREFLLNRIQNGVRGIVNLPLSTPPEVYMRKLGVLMSDILYLITGSLNDISDRNGRVFEEILYGIDDFSSVIKRYVLYLSGYVDENGVLNQRRI